MVFSNLLLLLNHFNGPLGANESADPTAFAVVVIDLNMTRRFVPCDAEVRAKVPTKITASTEVVHKAAGCLLDCRFLVQTRFSATQVIGRFLLRTTPDLQFARLNHFSTSNQTGHRNRHEGCRKRGTNFSVYFAASAVNHLSFASK